LRGDMFSENDQQFDASLRRRHCRFLRHRGRNKHDGHVAADCRDSICGGCENRHANMGFAGALRVDARHYVRAVAEHLLGPKCALLAGDAEHNDAIFFADDHCAAFTAAWIASSMTSYGSTPSSLRTSLTASA